MHITNGKQEALSWRMCLFSRDRHLLLNGEVFLKSRQQVMHSWSPQQCVSPGPLFSHWPYKPCCHMCHMVEGWRLLSLPCSSTNHVPCVQGMPHWLFFLDSLGACRGVGRICPWIWNLVLQVKGGGRCWINIVHMNLFSRSMPNKRRNMSSCSQSDWEVTEKRPFLATRG